MQCSFPQRRYDKSEDRYITYPCGRCRACRRNRAREWGFRAYAESLSYKDNCIFLSLSFDDDNLIFGKKGFPTLSKEVLQTFWKDMRYYCGKLRYLACGEYGDNTHRPHYHAIVFGVSKDNPVFTDLFYSPRKKSFIGRCKAWKYGEVCIGDVTIGSCQYCAKYVVKRRTGKSGNAYYEKYGILPEFATMSRKPGLGYQYLIDNMDLIKSRNFVMLKGSKIKLPRYYENKLFEDGSDELEEYKFEKQQKANEPYQDFFKARTIGHFTRHEYMKKWLEQQEINLEKQDNMKGV